MRIKLLICSLVVIGWNTYTEAQGFTSPSLQWNIPISTDSNDFQIAELRHAVIDMNGDKLPDFVDTENQSTEGIDDVFLNGSQKYWKVYLNTGAAFSPTAIQWNIPISTDSNDFQIAEIKHNVIDMNGDGLPDFVDTENQATEGTNDVFLNGSQKYWKVYLNTGSGFSPNAIQWNIPISSDSNDFQLAEIRHTVIDMDGDDKPDFVDTENQSTEGIDDVFLNGSQKYWKVYFNTGSGFSATATQWNVPISTDSKDFQIAEIRHAVVDMNGDKKPDLVDTENQSSEGFDDVFLNGSQKYWKVYFNTGSGFSAAATQWNIPISTDSNDFQIAEIRHAVVDMNGDRKPDFVDTENQSSEGFDDVFLNGSQKYWKVYFNTGSGFSAAATQWNIPIVSDSNDFQIAETKHNVIDMDGDRNPDFVDTENEATQATSDVFLNGSQKYWKVYLNNSPDLGTSNFDDGAGTIALYPNPTKNEFRIQGNDNVSLRYFIYDLTGKLLFNGTAKYNESINSTALKSGLYLIKTIDDNNIGSTLKIIKE
jgi:glutamine amidotransferase-like uncharacterized protein